MNIFIKLQVHGLFHSINGGGPSGASLGRIAHKLKSEIVAG